MRSRSFLLRSATALAIPTAMALGASCGDDDVSSSGTGGGSGTTGSSAAAGGGGGAGGHTVEGVVLGDPPPPPIAGGTLLVLSDGFRAVAADADRDEVYVVDLQDRKLLATIPLEPGDEPGRVVEDSQGGVHVVLRRSGGVASLSADLGGVSAVRRPCPAPRGLAFAVDFVDPSGGVAPALHVACMDGRLVTLPLSGDVPLRTVALPQDLRDVVVTDSGQVVVTRLQSAEVLLLDADGAVIDTLVPRSPPAGSLVPSTAFRSLRLPGGGVAMLHQRAQVEDLGVDAGVYRDGDCAGAVVQGTMSLFDELDSSKEPDLGAYLAGAVLAVDAAISDDGKSFAVVSAGTRELVRTTPEQFRSDDVCGPQTYGDDYSRQKLPGQPVAVAFDGIGRVVVQSREPAEILLLDKTIVDGASTVSKPIVLSETSRFDTGHETFHTAASENSIIACASCHIEGGDDGLTRQFVSLGSRRTQNIRGGVSHTAPFHWDGSLADPAALLADTLSKRMGGPDLDDDHVFAVVRWLDSIPELPSLEDPQSAAALRGKVLFEDPVSACVSCHVGDRLTNNLSEDIGKGAPLQVPSLIGVGYRAPFMHDGCAATLSDRFDPSCGGTDHGRTDFDENEIADLVAYMRSL